MEKTINNSHVVIYGHEMLKEAVSRARRNDIPFDREMYYDFLCHDNNYLVYSDNQLTVVQDPTPEKIHEISLNDLFEQLAYGDMIVGEIYIHLKGIGIIEYLGDGTGKGSWKGAEFESFMIPDKANWRLATTVERDILKNWQL